MNDEDDSAPLTRDIAPFGLRMPPALKSRIKRAADENGRSLNAELVSALSSFFPPPETGENVAAEVLKEILIADADIREDAISIVRDAVNHPDFLDWIKEVSRSLPEDEFYRWSIATGAIKNYFRSGKFVYDKHRRKIKRVPFEEPKDPQY